MAIAFDAASNNTGAQTVTSVSWTHTCTGTGTDGILVIIAGEGNSGGGAVDISSATYNSAGATAITSFSVTDSNFVRVEGFYQLLPATGAHTVQVNYASTVEQACAGSVSYTGVNQSTPFGTAATAGGSGTNASVTVSSATGELVVGGIASDSEIGAGGVTINGGTSRWELEGLASDTSYAQGEWTGAASVTVRWDQGNTGWAVGGVSMKPVGAGGAAPRVPSTLTLTGVQ